MGFFKKVDVDIEKTKEIEALRFMFRRYGQIVHCLDGHKNLLDPTSLEHLRWMIDEILDLFARTTVTDKNIKKGHRWLGYIQGVLVGKGLISIKTEMTMARDMFK